MNLIFDCDSVLLDWEAGFAEWCYHRHGIELDATGPASYDMRSWTGRDPQTNMRLVREFNASADFGELLPCIGAVNVIMEASSLGYDILALSSCGKGLTEDMRRSNLKAVFGDVFDAIQCLPLGSPKRAALEAISKSSMGGPGIMYDDHPDQCLHALAAGYDAALVLTKASGRLRASHPRYQSLKAGNGILDAWRRFGVGESIKG